MSTLSEGSLGRCDMKIRTGVLLFSYFFWQLTVAHGCLHGQLRLVNGSIPNAGRLEICIMDQWGTICNDGWTHDNAEVACRQLGYSTDGAVFLDAAFFGAGNGSIFLNQVVCSGSESTILQCRHSRVASQDCNHDKDISVHCSESASVKESVNNVTVCNTDFNDELWTMMSSNGSCEPYYKHSSVTSVCDAFYNPDIDYVYIPKRRLRGSQYLLRQFMEEVNFLPDECREIAVQIMCVHYYLPCGANGTLHVPLPICPDVCRYMSETLCPNTWQFTIGFLASNQVALEYRYDAGILLPPCNDTGKLIDYLNLTSDCCSDGGVVVPATVTVLSSSSLTSNTGSPSSTLTVALPVAAVVILLLLAAFIAMILVGYLIRKRKRASHLEITEIPLNIKFTEKNIYEPLEVPSTYMNQLSKYVITGSSIDIQETVGQGEFGIVYHGVMTGKGGKPQAVAAKTLKGVYDKSNVDSLLDECIMMLSFNDLNVLPLIGVCLDLGPAPYIIMPFMSRGSLLSYLKKERPNLTVSDTNDEDVILNVRKHLLSLCLQVAKGMSYLASLRFIHRDLAARNCMIDDNGIIKVADFGLSEDVYAKNYFRQLKGDNNDPSSSSVKLPVKWMALESLHDGLFSEKSDVWSYGVLCWEVFSLGKTPYPGLDPVGVVELLDTGGRLHCPHNEACSQEMYTLMLLCWSESPTDRPFFRDLVTSINTLIEPLANYMEFTDYIC